MIRTCITRSYSSSRGSSSSSSNSRRDLIHTAAGTATGLAAAAAAVGWHFIQTVHSIIFWKYKYILAYHFFCIFVLASERIMKIIEWYSNLTSINVNKTSQTTYWQLAMSSRRAARHHCITTTESVITTTTKVEVMSMYPYLICYETFDVSLQLN